MFENDIKYYSFYTKWFFCFNVNSYIKIRHKIIIKKFQHKSRLDLYPKLCTMYKQNNNKYWNIIAWSLCIKEISKKILQNSSQSYNLVSITKLSCRLIHNNETSTCHTLKKSKQFYRINENEFRKITMIIPTVDSHTYNCQKTCLDKKII